MQCPFDDLGCKFGHYLDTQVVDIIDKGKRYTDDIFNHEVQGDCLEVKKDDKIMMNTVFEDIPIFTYTPKKSNKSHNCSKNNYSKCDDCLDELLKHLNKDEDMRTWPPDRLLRCLALSA